MVSTFSALGERPQIDLVEENRGFVEALVGELGREVEIDVDDAMIIMRGYLAKMEELPYGVDPESDLADEVRLGMASNYLFGQVHYYLARHMEQVGRGMAAVAEAMQCTREEIARAYVGGIIHDGGKAAYPHLLGLQRKFTDEEIEEMRGHVMEGYNIARLSSTFSQEVLDVVLGHHEKLNGKGYPRIHSGKQISLLESIAYITDCFHAATDPDRVRIYKKPITVDEYMKEIQDDPEGELNPKVVATVVEMRDTLEEILFSDCLICDGSQRPL